MNVLTIPRNMHLLVKVLYPQILTTRLLVLYVLCCIAFHVHYLKMHISKRKNFSALVYTNSMICTIKSLAVWSALDTFININTTW